MARKVIQPKTLNDPRPRYSQAILNQGGKLLFVAGQTASDQNGQVVGKGDIGAQTEQVFANLKAVLKAAGGTLDDLVMTTTYIVDRECREGYNEVRQRQYKKNPPTSTLVIVKGLAHPDYLIEISGIAVIAK
ncbi:MAG TPA: RidA family protein [Terriglobales bacterium]|nr:RidA family protein [Terriglobales bacterium]